MGGQQCVLDTVVTHVSLPSKHLIFVCTSSVVAVLSCPRPLHQGPRFVLTSALLGRPQKGKSMAAGATQTHLWAPHCTNVNLESLLNPQGFSSLVCILATGMAVTALGGEQAYHLEVVIAEQLFQAWA